MERIGRRKVKRLLWLSGVMWLLAGCEPQKQVAPEVKYSYAILTCQLNKAYYTFDTRDGWDWTFYDYGVEVGKNGKRYHLFSPGVACHRERFYEGNAPV